MSFVGTSYRTDTASCPEVNGRSLAFSFVVFLVTHLLGNTEESRTENNGGERRHVRAWRKVPSADPSPASAEVPHPALPSSAAARCPPRSPGRSRKIRSRRSSGRCLGQNLRPGVVSDPCAVPPARRRFSAPRRSQGRPDAPRLPPFLSTPRLPRCRSASSTRPRSDLNVRAQQPAERVKKP